MRPHAQTRISGPQGIRDFTYDANGNMVTDGTRTLVWDAQNKLASVTPLGGGQAVTFQYGPDGSRIAKLSSFTGKRIYADADFEIAPDGTFILYPHADVKIEGLQTTWLHRDHLNSVRVVSDDNGQAVEKSVYAPFGERTSDGATPSSAATKGYIPSQRLLRNRLSGNGTNATTPKRASSISTPAITTRPSAVLSHRTIGTPPSKGWGRTDMRIPPMTR